MVSTVQVTLSDNEPDDLFLLATAYLDAGKHARALHLLERHGLRDSSAIEHLRFRQLAAQCLIESGELEDALGILEESLPEEEDAVLALAEAHGSEPPEQINLVAAMCSLRAKVYVKLDNRTRAVPWFLRALQCDPFCTEAFDALVDGHLLTLMQERALKSTLEELLQQDAPWLLDLYVARLELYDVRVSAADKTRSLEQSTEDGGHGLAGNLDVLAAKAVAVYHHHDIAGAHQITSRIFEEDPYHEGALTVHIACLHLLQKTSDLFLTSHRMVDAHPGSALSWFAIGCYYLTTKEFGMAREHFRKATTLDSACAPAWLGLGHSASALAENDQASAAYRTASRRFVGSHLPLVFLAMECLPTNSPTLAEQYLHQARDVCASDPLVYNEMGVLMYRQGRYENARKLFEFVLELTRGVPERLQQVWESARYNLGHALRKLGDFEGAIRVYEACLSRTENKASVFSSLGFAHHLSGNLDKAVDMYHAALGLAPLDTFSQQLLTRALESKFSGGFDAAFPSDAAVETKANDPGASEGAAHAHVSFASSVDMSADAFTPAADRRSSGVLSRKRSSGGASSFGVGLGGGAEGSGSFFQATPDAGARSRAAQLPPSSARRARHSVGSVRTPATATGTPIAGGGAPRQAPGLRPKARGRAAAELSVDSDMSGAGAASLGAGDVSFDLDRSSFGSAPGERDAPGAAGGAEPSVDVSDVALLMSPAATEASRDGGDGSTMMSPADDSMVMDDGA